MVTDKVSFDTGHAASAASALAGCYYWNVFEFGVCVNGAKGTTIMSARGWGRLLVASAHFHPAILITDQLGVGHSVARAGGSWKLIKRPPLLVNRKVV